MRITWRDVFDAKMPYKHIDQLARAATAAGYRYFAWQGGVYWVIDTEDVRRTEHVADVRDIH
jgi:hypothetical protein